MLLPPTKIKLRRNAMENQFSISEMERMSVEYWQGRDLDCPRCHERVDAWAESGPLLLNQVPGGPEFQCLVVECPNGHHGKTLLGR